MTFPSSQTNIKGDTMCNPFNVATKVVCLEHAVQEEELADDQVLCIVPFIVHCVYCALCIPTYNFNYPFNFMKTSHTLTHASSSNPCAGV